MSSVLESSKKDDDMDKPRLTKRMKKPGEGDRERRKCKWGEGGRPIEGSVKRREAKRIISKPSSEKVKSKPLKPRPASTFNVVDGKVDDQFLDQMLGKSDHSPRPTRACAQKDAELERAKERFSILRDEPEEDQALVIAENPSEAALVADKRGKRTKYTQQQQEDLAAILNVPGVLCDYCQANEQCPHAEQGGTCYYDEAFSGLTTRDSDNLLPVLEHFADVQVARARRAVFLEQNVTGGQLDPNVTRQIDVAMAAAERVAALKGAIGASQKRTMAAVSVNEGGGGGIVSQLIAAVASNASAGEEQSAGKKVIEAAIIEESSTPRLKDG